MPQRTPTVALGAVAILVLALLPGMVNDYNVQALMVNHWTASNDYVFAFPYGPVSGGTTYRFFEDGTVRGAVELVGHGGMGGTSTYSAVLSGVRVQ